MTIEEPSRGVSQEQGIYYRFIPKGETIHTADAASAAGIELHRITKNLISVTDRRANLRRASKVLGEKNVRLLSPEEAEAVSGYPTGGTPSLGYRWRVRVIVDDELTKLERIFCGGGSRDLLLEVRVEDVIRLNEAIVASISEP